MRDYYLHKIVAALKFVDGEDGRVRVSFDITMPVGMTQEQADKSDAVQMCKEVYDLVEKYSDHAERAEHAENPQQELPL